MRLLAPVVLLTLGGAGVAEAAQRPRLKACASGTQLVDYARAGAVRTHGRPGVTGRAAPIPVDEIRGTAVEGPQQRGLDFKPLPAFKSKNWQARWQRILRAAKEMRSLPPIDVLPGGAVFRLFSGPFASREEAAAAAQKLVEAGSVKSLVVQR